MKPARTRFARAAAILCLAGFLPASAWPGPIIGGNEWRQLTETLNLTWNQVNAVCPNDGLTSCSGAIHGAVRPDGTFDIIADLTGWTWATHVQVQALFGNAAIGVPAPATDVTQLDSPWAPAALALFDPTVVVDTGPFREFDTSLREIIGFVSDTFTLPGETRDPIDPAPLHTYTPFIADFVNGHHPETDRASTTAEVGPDALNRPLSGVGVWLFRAAPDAAAPEPGTLALLAIGMAGLGWRRRDQE